MESLGQWVWLIPLAPLIGSICVAIFGGRLLKEQSHWPIWLGVGLAMVLSLTVLVKATGIDPHDHHGPIVVPGYDWINIGGLQSLIQAAVDPLTAIMLATVSVVGFLVMVYSKGYMHGDPGYFRFFIYLGLFVFSMLMLVLADNFLMLYVFWEAVGLCSYLLIGYYYKKPSAAAAAKKAFLLNRIGDFGFAIGILLIVLNFKTISFAGVFEQITPEYIEANQALLTTIALCLFLGACGKSAQLPLYVWLPDAMEGPSPVSALIHAATMVTAGVYMTVRCGAIFTASPFAMGTVAVVGAATALFAATIAFSQTDLKRILAYSTVSQLGYMFLAVGVGAATAGIFHLFTHAFFKALLFLGAGSVMHAMGDKIDLREFGGLKKDIPFTHWTFLIGSAALAGVPFITAGFWSKEMILSGALHHPQLAVLGWVAVLTAGLTAFYTFRGYFMCFHGPRFLPEGVHHPHESKIMNFCLIVLAVGAIGVGFLGADSHGHGGWLGHFLDGSESVHHYYAYKKSLHAEGGLSHGAITIISILIVTAGIGLAWFIYLPNRDKAKKITSEQPLAGVDTILANKYYVDEGYDQLFVKPLHRSGRLFVNADNHLIDNILVVITNIPKFAGGLCSALFQRGNLQSYAFWMIAGMVIMIWGAIFDRGFVWMRNNWVWVLLTLLLVVAIRVAFAIMPPLKPQTAAQTETK